MASKLGESFERFAEAEEPLPGTNYYNAPRSPVDRSSIAGGATICRIVRVSVINIIVLAYKNKTGEITWTSEHGLRQ
ncbi:MAG: hypothetical protein ACREYC_03755 [Gammaproteobacteria bacterium]